MQFMAKIVKTIERDGDTINIYESGAEYNMTRGRLVAPASANLITADNAIAYNRRRQELARAELIAGANEAVQHLRPDDVPIAGDLAYVRAIGYVTTQKALSPKDAKQVDAARMLLSIGERLGDVRAAETINNTFNFGELSADVAKALVDLHATITSKLHDTDAGEVIDAG